MLLKSTYSFFKTLIFQQLFDDLLCIVFTHQQPCSALYPISSLSHPLMQVPSFPSPRRCSHLLTITSVSPLVSVSCLFSLYPVYRTCSYPTPFPLSLLLIHYFIPFGVSMALLSASFIFHLLLNHLHHTQRLPSKQTSPGHTLLTALCVSLLENRSVFTVSVLHYFLSPLFKR